MLSRLELKKSVNLSRIQNPLSSHYDKVFLFFPMRPLPILLPQEAINEPGSHAG